MRKLLRKFVVWVMGANNRDDRPVLATEQDIQERPQASFRLGVIAASKGRK